MSIAAILRELIAAGVTGDALVAAIERIEAASAPVRSSAAVRQQRYRDRKAETVTRDVTSVTSVTEPPPKVSPNDITLTPILTPPTKHTPRAAPKSVKPGFHRLPDDWQPGPLPASLAAEEPNWPAGWIDQQADRFRAWAANAADTDGKGRKLKWDQAFHNWLRENKNDHTAGRNGPLRGSGPGRILDRPGNLGTPRQQAIAEIRADLERAGYGGAH